MKRLIFISLFLFLCYSIDIGDDYEEFSIITSRYLYGCE